jgi:hypothetical protein
LTDGAQRKEPSGGTPRIGGLVDSDVSSSESESESESDYESDRERPAGGHTIILDASKNQATDTKESVKGRSVGEQGRYRVSRVRECCYRGYRVSGVRECYRGYRVSGVWEYCYRDYRVSGVREYCYSGYRVCGSVVTGATG